MTKKNKEREEENPKVKKIKIILIIIVLIYLVIGKVYSLIKSKETSSNNVVSIVTEEYEYLRVSDGLSKYVNLVNSKNAKEIISIYASEYKENNNITLDNVMDINNLSNIVGFKIRKMYRDDTHYYVFVSFYSESEESNVTNNMCELTIQFYKNNTFAIIPQINENIMIQGDI